MPETVIHSSLPGFAGRKLSLGQLRRPSPAPPSRVRTSASRSLGPQRSGSTATGEPASRRVMSSPVTSRHITSQWRRMRRAFRQPPDNNTVQLRKLSQEAKVNQPIGGANLERLLNTFNPPNVRNSNSPTPDRLVPTDTGTSRAANNCHRRPFRASIGAPATFVPICALGT